MLRNNEDVSYAFFHSDCNQMALIFFLDHLLKSLYVNRVELSFDNHDLPWRPDVHSLSHSDTYLFIFTGIYSVDSQRVVLRIVLETFNLECTSDNLFFDFYETCCLFLYLTMASASDEVASVQQIIYVPYIVRILVEIHSYQKNLFLPVNDLLDYLHF